MKTVIVLSLFAVLACNDHKKEPVDQTRTTSAILVQPTLHDGHAAAPNVDENFDQDAVDQEMEIMDVDRIDMSGATEARDASTL